MKWIIMIAAVILVIPILIRLFAVSSVSSAPEGYSLGAKDGRLAPCKPYDNCVSSQSSPDNQIHYAEPIQIPQ